MNNTKIMILFLLLTILLFVLTFWCGKNPLGARASDPFSTVFISVSLQLEFHHLTGYQLCVIQLCTGERRFDLAAYEMNQNVIVIVYTYLS